MFDPLGADFGAGGSAEGGKVALYRGDGVTIIVDERAVGGAARQGFEPKCAGACEQIGDPQPLEASDPALKHREKPLRVRSAVGRVARPSGATSGRPRHSPAIMRMS
jgi:hypothetical protein